MSRLLALFRGAAFALSASLASAQVNYGGGVYTQNFDTLSSANNALNVPWSDNATLPGWYATKTSYHATNGTVGGTAATFDSTSGTANNVGLFSFGTAASSDRALGSRATSNFPGNDPVRFGVRLVNTSGRTLTQVAVAYRGEQWFKSTVATAHGLSVDYQLGATSLSTGTWTTVSALAFTSPIATGTTATALDGNATANRRGLATTLTGLSWAPGAELWIRFTDANESGSEQGLAIDDVAVWEGTASALHFDGRASYVTMGAATAALGASNLTLECWFMRTGSGITTSTGTGGVTAAIPLVTKGRGEADGSSVDCNYFFGIDTTTNTLCADFEAQAGAPGITAGQNYPVYGTTVIQTGVWYHAAATYDTATSTWKLYLNGALDATFTNPAGAAPRADSIQHFAVGTALTSTGAAAGFFQGAIDEVRVWNVARTPAEIAAGKDTQLASPVAGLLARYGFNEGTGTSAAGLVVGAPAGTLTAGPAWVAGPNFTPNVLPTVALTSPTADYSGVFPATVSFAATASDSDGAIARVELFNGATKVGEDASEPYAFAWTNVAAGTYTLTAVAIDNAGGSTTSAPVTITVAPNPNQPPVVALTTPADGATGIGASTTLALSIADPEGDGATVTFYGRKTTPVTPGPDFVIGTLPDTQFYSENVGGTRAATFYGQTQWYVDNRDALNLAFVSHMGDIVEHGDNGGNPSEWIVADTAMRTIENQAATLRAYGIPWGAAPGNHDQSPGGDAAGTTTFYNQYFGTARFAGRPYSGGNFGANNDNNYQLFSASGLDFIIIHLEYDTRALSFYQPVLDWADALLKAHPNRRGIVTSH